MKPVLFTIGSFNVYAFGIFLCLSFILSTFIIWKYAKEELKEEEYLDLFLYTNIISLIFARGLYIYFHFDDFRFNLPKYFLVRESPGLSLLGGLISAFLFLWWYSKKKKFNFFHILDLFSLAGSIALVFAKIGEQLGGAGFGKETNFFLGVNIVGASGRHYPAEFYEALIFLLLFFLLTFVYHKIQKYKWPEGSVFCLFTLITGLTIFLIEFLKVRVIYLGGLSIRQITALVLVILIIWPVIKRLKMINIVR